MSTTFDANELGQLAKHDFVLQIDVLADREKGDTYVGIRKLHSTLFEVRKEQGNSVKVKDYTTLKEALRAL